MPLHEARHAVVTEFAKAFDGLLGGLLSLWVRLAEEFVGVADELFLDGLGEEILVGQGEVALHYLPACDACSRVPLAYPCMAGEALGAQPLGSYASVADVGLGAVAVDAGSIAEADAYIVEHGCFKDELAVDAELGM